MEVPDLTMDGKIPVFNVLKKGINIKNIVLSCPLPPSTGDDDYAYKILMGRHPDCEIVVDHPSISRFHLEVQLLNQKLFVVDLSSVHGTYVSGKKIDQHFPVELSEGDVLKLGASTRVYILRWIPIRDAYELERPLASLLEEEEHCQDDDCASLIDNFDGLNLTTIPSAPPMPEFMSTSSVIPLEDCRLMKEFEDFKKNSFPVCSSPVSDESKEINPQILSPPRLEKGVMSSGLLSRRNKTVSLLRVHTGRSNEKIAEENFNAKVELEKNNVNGEEYIREILFPAIVNANDDEPDDNDDESFVSDKENMISTVPSCLQMPQYPCFDTNLERKGAEEEEKSIHEVEGEEAIISDKENMTPESSLSNRSGSFQRKVQRSRLSVVAMSKRKDKELLYSLEDENREASFTEFTIGKGEGSLCRVLFSASREMGTNDEEGDEGFISDKDHTTPGVSQSRKLNMLQRSSLFFATTSKGKKSKEENIAESVVRKEEFLCRFLFPDGHSKLMGQEVLDDDDCNDEEESFLSDKENLTPGAALISLKSRKDEQKLWKSSETVAVNSTTENRTETCHLYKIDSTQELFWTESHAKLQSLALDEPISANLTRIEADIMKRRTETVPFESLLEDSSTKSPLSEAKVADSENSLSSEMKSTKRRMERIPFQCLPGLSLDEETDDLEDELFRSDKENMTLQVSAENRTQTSHLYKIDSTQELFWTESHAKLQSLSLDEETDDLEDELFTSDKENMTPQVSAEKAKEPISENLTRVEADIMKRRIERVPFQSLLEDSFTKSPLSEAKVPDSENSLSSEIKSTKRRIERVPFQCLQDNSISSSKSPQSEVKKSNSSNLSSEKGWTSKRRVERVPFQPLVQNSISNSLSSPCFNAASPYVCSGLSKPKQPLTKHDTRMQKETARIPSQSLLEICTDKNRSSCAGIADFAIHLVNDAFKAANGRKKKWNIVADISCFTNEESRKSLQLLEGIRGTHLVIPGLVLRELDYLKRQENMFRKGTKASSVLLWIEKCMVQTSWWIEVQRSGEMMPIAPTPPASPSTELNERIDIFSSHGRLSEIVSPTAEDHILDCAMLFKRIKHDGLVLLTKSTSLKIKAMAEGILCETSTEFRESLVSPFSERFLWADSSPRGSTWSCSDEVELIESHYQHCPTLRRSAKEAEGAKGLKLILLHNANYVQLNSARC